MREERAYIQSGATRRTPKRGCFIDVSDREKAGQA
jgi:hypothetical protein